MKLKVRDKGLIRVQILAFIAMVASYSGFASDVEWIIANELPQQAMAFKHGDKNDSLKKHDCGGGRSPRVSEINGVVTSECNSAELKAARVYLKDGRIIKRSVTYFAKYNVIGYRFEISPNPIAIRHSPDPIKMMWREFESQHGRALSFEIAGSGATIGRMIGNMLTKVDAYVIKPVDGVIARYEHIDCSLVTDVKSDDYQACQAFKKFTK